MALVVACSLSACRSSGEQKLQKGIHECNLALVEEALAESADPNMMIDSFWDDSVDVPALFAAVECGNRDIVQLLLENKAAPNAQNDEGVSVFGLAAGLGGIDVCDRLYQYGAKTDGRDNHGYTALERMLTNVTASSTMPSNADDAMVDKIDALIEMGVPVSYDTFACIYRTSSGELSDQYYLTQYVANKIADTPSFAEQLPDVLRMAICGTLSPQTEIPDLTDWSTEEKQALLFYTLAFGQTNHLEQILHQGIDLTKTDAWGNTALSVAAAFNDLDMVVYVLQNSQCDIQQTNQNGVSALDLALSRGKVENAAYLQKQGAAFSHAQDGNDNFDTLQLCAAKGQLASLQFLYESSYETNEVSLSLAFEWALWHDHTETAQYLITHFAMSPTLYGQMGYVLSRACEYGDKEVAELLISKGASVDGPADDPPLLSAITYPSQEKSLAMVTCLVEKGADVNRCDSTGETALQRAVSYGQIDVVEYLLNAGAVITDDAMQTAKESGCKRMVSLLQN